MPARRLSLGRLAAVACGLALVAAVGSRAADVPTGRVVADVVPLNLKVNDPEYVKGLMFTRPGRPYNDDTANQDVQRLYNSKLFTPNSVRISTSIAADGRVTVFVYADEIRGTVTEVKFNGREHLSDSELLDLTGLKRGSAMNPANNELARLAILNKLREDGRLYASVTLVRGKSMTDTTVEFDIVEGPKVRVKTIEFRGNTQATTGRLATQTVSSVALIPRTITALSPKYNAASPEEDKKKLLTYYHRLGYLDARIREEIRPDPRDPGVVTLVYHISEGSPYTVREVKIDGNKTFPEDQLRTLTQLRPGQVYDIDVVTADEKRIETKCGNGGYATRVMHQKYAVENQPGVVDVYYQVVEQNREPQRIGRVRVEGNTITQQRVILNELGPLLPGQILQYPAIEQAKRNLERRQLFDQEDPPSITVVPSEFDDGFVDLLVRVKETRTGMAAVQANVNSDAGVNGSITLNQRNFDIRRLPTSWDDLFSGNAFRGAGQELRVEAQPGTLYQRYAVTFREPYLFDSKYGLTTSGYYFSRNYAEYTESRVGLRNTIDYRFADSPIWKANAAVRIEDVQVSNVPNWATRAIRDYQGHSTVLGLRGGLNRDTRDSFLLPSSGSVLDIGFEQVLGDYTFPIGTLEYQKYFTTWQRKDGSGRHVLSAQTQLTVMGQNAPVFEKVFAGGIRSFRGFSFRGVGPYENQLNVGGTFGFLNSVEYQVPLLANDKLFAAFFCDHGTVERNFAIHDYRVSVGAGVRIVVPALGPLPIALDFAVPLSRTPSDNKQLFSVYMGVGIGR